MVTPVPSGVCPFPSDVGRLTPTGAGGGAGTGGVGGTGSGAVGSRPRRRRRAGSDHELVERNRGLAVMRWASA